MSDITGKLVKILPEQSGEGKNGTWQKQEFVIETIGEYPRKVCFENWNRKPELKFQVGEIVKVFYEPSSREYNEKWYTNLKCWKIDKIGATSVTATVAPPPATTQAEPAPASGNPFQTEPPADDNLPF